MELSNMVAGMSVSMSNAQISTSVDTAMMKKAMDTQESLAQSMIEAIDGARIFPGENGYNFNATA